MRSCVCYCEVLAAVRMSDVRNDVAFRFLKFSFYLFLGNESFVGVQLLVLATMSMSFSCCSHVVVRYLKQQRVGAFPILSRPPFCFMNRSALSNSPRVFFIFLFICFALPLSKSHLMNDELLVDFVSIIFASAPTSR